MLLLSILQVWNWVVLGASLGPELTPCSYSIALRENKGNPAAMSGAALAILWHYSDTADPHSHCPSGPDSWCKWQKDQATGNSTVEE